MDALAQGAYEFLFDRIDTLEETDDPASDLVDVGALGFRALVLEHPARYRIAFQRVVPEFDPGPELRAARERAWNQLLAKVQRLEDAGLLGERTVLEAAVEFNAMLEGLANAELRGTIFPNLPPGSEEAAWRAALTTLVGAFAILPTEPRGVATASAR